MEIRVSNVDIDGSRNIHLQIGSDRRLPPGLVYVVAICVIAVIVVLARYPPKNLEEFLERISSVGISPDVEQDNPDNISPKDKELKESEE